MTPFTQVHEIPSDRHVNIYCLPILELPSADNWNVSVDGGVLVPYKMLTIELDKAHRDFRGYYQYGYNAERDILVYRRLED
jgi:hypothetical protein